MHIADAMAPMTWEAPRITPLQLDRFNKFGTRRRSCQTREKIDGVAVDTLVERYGSPLFVLSERRLRANVRRLRQGFRDHGVAAVHGWSYKTNYHGAVCSLLHQEGSWAEVVSRFEYEKARALGVPGERILFNGPNKPRATLEQALAEGARIHVDHFDELAMLEDIARQRGQVAAIGLRVNFDTGFSEPWSRFGFNLESGQADEALARVRTSPHLRLNALHCHIGTFILDPRAYVRAVETLCRLARQEEEQGAPLLEYLDIGGGFPSRNALQGIYLPPEQAVPELEEYTRAVSEAFLPATAWRVAKDQPRPLLVFESGRAVVDDAGFLISTVTARKPLPDGRPGAILDAGLNLLFTALWYDHEVRPARELAGDPRETVLYGPLCMNIDVVRRSVQLPPLTPGDRLVISPAGAYNNTQWMQFIEYRPAVAMVMADGCTELIRPAEDLSAVTELERIPASLASIAETSPL